jgi:anti-sigma-K factor RskA
MNTTSHDDTTLNTLAGEYVLGTLTADERRDVQARLEHDDVLRAAVHQWEERLLPLVALTEPVAPSGQLWTRIDRSLQAAAVPATGYLTPAAQASDIAGPVTSSPATDASRRTQAAAPATAPSRRPAASASRGWRGWRGWTSLPLWRGLSTAGFACALVLATVIARQEDTPAPVAPQFLVVLAAPQGNAPGWVVQAHDTNQVQLIPLGVMEVPAGKALEFWTKADDWKAPVSLGLIAPGQPVRIPLDALPPLQNNQLFELTLEPASGSPTGLPTGPIQFIGRAVKVL